MIVLCKVLVRLHGLLTAPFAILAIITSTAIHPHYRMNVFRRFGLGVRMFLNTLFVRTGTSFKAHLVMALKLLETAPEVEGCVVECGTWKGGSAANLSLVCRIVGRKLKIYDSFQGLPAGESSDREARHYRAGDYRGTLDEVRGNLRRFGAIEVCEFVPGWLEATLPSLDVPVVLAFVDVDLEASLHTCVRYIWPHLTEQGHFFIDEAVGTDYVALFFSERWWQRHFNRTPPGLIGAGSGLSLGDVFVGPYGEWPRHPLWMPNAVGYTQKCMSGVWSYRAKGEVE
jgi:O-methyltransferase